MQKTTVYLPDDLKQAIATVAAEQGMSEAELIRSALRAAVAKAPAPRPRLPLFISGKTHLAEKVDDYLSGFGQH